MRRFVVVLLLLTFASAQTNMGKIEQESIQIVTGSKNGTILYWEVKYLTDYGNVRYWDMRSDSKKRDRINNLVQQIVKIMREND